MGQLNDWFCANCLRTIDKLSRHGRCPFCDSNAVDVASRRRALCYSDRSSLPSCSLPSVGIATATVMPIAISARN